MERGKIKNRDFAAQIKDYTGLRYGNITPTDIDGFIDFGDKVFIIIELKFKGAEMPYGQRLALERLADSIQGKEVLVIVAEHSAKKDIIVESCTVVMFRFFKKWHEAGPKTTVKGLIDRYLKLHAPEYLTASV